MSFIASLIKVQATSVEGSAENLKHFAGILDHATKVVTTLALLVGLSLLNQEHPSQIVLAVYFILWVFFFIYLQRLFEHCIMFCLDNWFGKDLRSDKVRWSIGITSFVFGMLLIFAQNSYFDELVEIGFLQDGKQEIACP